MPSPRPRTRVSQACRVCGFKKIKCGGELPRCKTCVLHNRECSYGVSRRNTRLNLMRPMLAPSFQGTQARDDEALRQLSVAAAGLPAEAVYPPLVSITSEESERLFQTYFSCIHPIWPLLYKPLYNSISYHQLASHLPKVVVYSIYAIAACLPSSYEDDALDTGNTEPSRPADSKPSFYFDAALSELQRGSNAGQGEFKLINALKPSVPHCQALIILALQQHGVAEFSRAGLMCGLASAMAIDLRLHRNNCSGDPIEKEVCSRLWWNIYILEMMMSFEMGRPVNLRYEETDTPYPSVAESDEFELFTPMRSKKSLGEEQPPPVKMRTLSAFATTIDMCKSMERISRQVYSLGSRESIRQDRATGDLVRMRLWKEMQDWRQGVENSPLKLDLNKISVTLPAMITNYVTTGCATILLHRPYITHWLQHIEQTGSPPFPTPDPSVICYESAKEMCVILETYSEYLSQLPCDLIFTIFTAASTLLHEIRQSNVELPGTRRQLRLCLHWLSVLGKNWKSGGERQKLLNELYEWPLQQELPREPLVLQTPNTLAQSSAAPLVADGTENIAQVDDMNFADILTSVDDWGFLDVYGDSTDNYYAMNMDFRNILERQNDAT